MKKVYAAFLALAAAVGILQPYPTLRAQSTDFAPIDSMALQLLRDWKVPGMAVAIIEGGKGAYIKGYGLRDLEAQLPVDGQTLFCIGSATKAFTALGVLQQAEAGLLNLDDPVAVHLPSFRMSDPYVSRHLTVKDLLCHRSGLPRHDLSWYGSPASREALIARLEHLAPSAGFRESFQYQNLMFLTAGYLAGQVSQSDWETQIETQIFEPLGMERTGFDVAEMEADPNAARPYALEEEQEVTRVPYRDIRTIGPAGSIQASAAALIPWLGAQLNGGAWKGQTIASPASIAACQQPAMAISEAWGQALLFDNQGAPSAYGLGWFLSHHKGHRLVAHGGNIDGFSAEVALLPGDSIGVAILSNLNGTPAPRILRNFIFDYLLGEEGTDWNTPQLARWKEMSAKPEAAPEDLARLPGTRPSHPLADYTGVYHNPGYDDLVIVEAGDGQLGLKTVSDTGLIRLEHYHYDVFTPQENGYEQLKIQFISNEEGKISQLMAPLEPALPPLSFERQPENRDFTVEELQAFAGDYLIMGVQKVQVRVEDGALKLEVPGQPVYTLEHVEEETFRLRGLDGYKARFLTGRDGKAQKITLLQPNGQFTGERQ